MEQEDMLNYVRRKVIANDGRIERIAKESYVSASTIRRIANNPDYKPFYETVRCLAKWFEEDAK